MKKKKKKKFKLTEKQNKLVMEMLRGAILVHHNFSYILYSYDGLKTEKIHRWTVSALEPVLYRTYIDEHKLSISILSRWVREPSDIENLINKCREQCISSD